MKNLWQLRFALDTAVINNHQNGVLQWSMDNYRERLKFTQDIINIFRSVISHSLSKRLRTILEFKITGEVSFDSQKTTG